ncbi:ketopantoate reductase family protein [Chloroflexota bacterium]
MRTVIIGAGAIGSIAGCYLAKAGRKTHLIDSNTEIVRKINRNSLELVSQTGQFIVKIKASGSILDFHWEPDDFILLCVKTQHSRVAIEQASQVAGEETPICCFQNSVQNEAFASQKFKYVYGGIVRYDGTYLEPGKVYHTGGNSVGVGVFPSGPIDDKLLSLIHEFKDTGISLYCLEDLMASKYAKLIRNMANAPCAIMGLTEPELFNIPEARRLFDDLLEESKRVLEVAGIKYDKSLAAFEPLDIDSIPTETPKELQVICSTHQDLILHRVTSEVDYLNGEIVALGKRYGVPTPINELMVKLVHDMVSRGETPGTYSVSNIRNILGVTTL